MSNVASPRRVLLIYPSYTPHPVPPDQMREPLALLTLHAALRDANIPCELVDGRVHRDPVAFFDGVGPEEPLFVGISAILGNQVGHGAAFAQEVRRRWPSVPIVWGGWFASVLPEVVLEQDFCDAVCIGMGEGAVVGLARAYAADSLPDAVPNVWYKRKGTIVRNPDGEVHLEWCTRLDYGIMGREHYPPGRIWYLSSRGCPYRCGFCSVPVVYRRRWRSLPARQVLEDLTAYRDRNGLSEVVFSDDDFFIDRDRVIAICKGFIDRGLDIAWYAHIRINDILRLEESDFDLIRKSGCRELWIGTEVASAHMLEKIQKDYPVEGIVPSLAKLLKAHIIPVMNMIVDLPGERDEDFRALTDLIRRVRAEHPEARISVYRFFPIPGSALFEEGAAARPGLPKTFEEWGRAHFDEMPEVFINTRWMMERYPETRAVELFYYMRGYYPPPTGALSAWKRALARFRFSHRLFRWPVAFYRHRRRLLAMKETEGS